MSLLSQAVIADSTLLSVKDMKEVKNIGHRFSVQNRQLQNNARTTLKDTVTIAGGVAASAGAAVAVSKFPALQNMLSKVINPIKDAIISSGIKEKALPILSKGMGFVKALPLPAKVAAAAITALVTLAIVKFNHEKRDYNNGKIVQEYIDKSKLEKTLN